MNAAEIENKTADGNGPCHAYHPAGHGPWPAVVYFMDGMGISGSLPDYARSLSPDPARAGARKPAVIFL